MLGKNIKTFLLVILFGAITFASGFYLRGPEEVIIDPTGDIDLSLFYEAYYVLEEKFPGFKEVDEEIIVHGAIRGMIDSLGDPHTAFFNKEESKYFLEDVAGEFEGVGIEIGIREERLQVISPLKGTPAYKAGIKSQDLITEIDGESTEGITVEEAVSKIRGPRGELVVLEVVRNGDTYEFEIVRDRIEIPSLEWEIIEEDIAHLQLFHFNENITSEFTKVAREIIGSNANGIILDLRNNPGGTFAGAIGVASRFLEVGETVVIKTGADNNREEHLEAIAAPPYLLEYPVVILVNEGTASAAEILAGALRDQKDAPVVGINTFGKGSIQGLHFLSDESTLKITEEYFLTPKKEIIDKKGIKPDFEVEITKEDLEEERDPQLKKAIEIIKNKH